MSTSSSQSLFVIHHFAHAISTSTSTRPLHSHHALMRNSFTLSFHTLNTTYTSDASRHTLLAVSSASCLHRLCLSVSPRRSGESLCSLRCYNVYHRCSSTVKLCLSVCPRRSGESLCSFRCYNVYHRCSSTSAVSECSSTVKRPQLSSLKFHCIKLARWQHPAMGHGATVDVPVTACLVLFSLICVGCKLATRQVLSAR